MEALGAQKLRSAGNTPIHHDRSCCLSFLCELAKPSRLLTLGGRLFARALLGARRWKRWPEQFGDFAELVWALVLGLRACWPLWLATRLGAISTVTL